VVLTPIHLVPPRRTGGHRDRPPAVGDTPQQLIADGRLPGPRGPTDHDQGTARFVRHGDGLCCPGERFSTAASDVARPAAPQCTAARSIMDRGAPARAVAPQPLGRAGSPRPAERTNVVPDESVRRPGQVPPEQPDALRSVPAEHTNLARRLATVPTTRGHTVAFISVPLGAGSKSRPMPSCTPAPARQLAATAIHTWRSVCRWTAPLANSASACG